MCGFHLQSLALQYNSFLMKNLSLKSFSEAVGKTAGLAAMRSGFALKALTAAFLILGGATACSSDVASNGPLVSSHDANNDASGRIDTQEADAGSGEPDTGGDGGPDPEDDAASAADAVKKLITVACPLLQEAVDDALKNIEGGCPLDDKETKDLEPDMLKMVQGHVDKFMSDYNSGKYKATFTTNYQHAEMIEFMLTDDNGYVNALWIFPGDENNPGFISLDNQRVWVTFDRFQQYNDPTKFDFLFNQIYTHEGGEYGGGMCPQHEFDPLKRITLDLVPEFGGAYGFEFNNPALTGEVSGSNGKGANGEGTDEFSCGVNDVVMSCPTEKWMSNTVKVLCQTGIKVANKTDISMKKSVEIANKILAMLKPLVQLVGNKQEKLNAWKTIPFEIEATD